MSVAFTREEDLEATAADLPDRPISPHPYLVTPSGLALIEAALASARAAYSAAQAHGSIEADRTAMARATRDLRYWSARRATAQLVETEPDGRVRFGHPSGTLNVGAEAHEEAGQWTVAKVMMSRSARRLMEGWVRVPEER